MAGHDINYVGVAGTLAALGRFGENPIPPANILGDFAGGGMLCIVGILIALLEREKSGKGQIVDAAMIDGITYLSTFLIKMHQSNLWSEPRGRNMLDTGAHFYETYRTRDGKYMAVGAIEPQFYKLLLTGLGLSVSEYAPKQMDMDEWEAMKEKFREIFKERTRDEWVQVFGGSDACVTPVLDWEATIRSDQFRERWGNYEGDYQDWNPPAAPILSRTPAECVAGKRNPEVGGDTVEVMVKAGYSVSEVELLQDGGVIGASSSKGRL
ncbi:UNVERIFIED_CONTAM: hypothetical protein HDU68_009683 [Siphonaria sp. JEL0065]|nr:hypothetical protein HDU68_009683 [Siphonaria sp. JEL0065]